MANEQRIHEVEVPQDALGTRLDAFLARALPDLSRSRLKALIDEGQVILEGRVAKASQKLSGGERVRVTEPPAPPSDIIPQEMPLSVLYEDDDLLVIDKPAGLVVHPGAGHADLTLANALRARLPDVVIGGVERPGIVHRLDKDTSGVMVCAKNERAHRALSAAFKERSVDKRYAAFCLGRPKREHFDLVTGHRRDAKNRKRFTTRLPPPALGEEGGNVRRAHSRFTLRRSAGGASELEVELLTGRTHQIRAHLADIGHPLLADALYGGAHPDRRLPPGPVRRAAERLTRHALHAERLAFAQPVTGAPLVFEAALPADLLALRRAIDEAGGSG